LAVVQDVIGAADAGRDLVSPAEMKRGEAIGIEWRHCFFVEPKPQTQTQTACAQRPRVLQVKRLGGCPGEAAVRYGRAANVEIAILALALPAAGCFDRVARCGACDRRVLLAPEERDHGSVRSALHIVALALPGVSELQVVGAAEICEIRKVRADALSLERI